MSRDPIRKFLVERGLPGIGNAQPAELEAAARKSNEALQELGPDIQWIESYVAANSIFCVYLAEDEVLIRDHADKSGFPADRITEIKTKIDPCTGGD